MEKTLTPGRVEDVTLEKKIAEGGSAIVYEGRYLDKPVVVKKMKIKSNGSFLAKMQQNVANYFIFHRASEAVLVSAVEREIVYMKMFGEGVFGVAFIASIEIKYSILIIMEKCLTTVKNLFSPNSPLQSEKVSMKIDVLLYVVVAVLKALEHIHEKNIVHLDVKPRNILISVDGIPKLSDFGIAVEINSEDYNAAKLKPKGSAFYMAPEIINHQDFDGRADLFALAVTAASLASNKPGHILIGMTTWDMAMEQYQIGQPEDLASRITRWIHSVGEHENRKKDRLWKFAVWHIFGKMCQFPVELRMSASFFLHDSAAAENELAYLREMKEGWEAFEKGSTPSPRFLEVKDKIIAMSSTIIPESI